MKGPIKVAAALAALFILAVILFHAPGGETAAGNADRLEIYYMYNEGESQQKWFADAAERFGKLKPDLEIEIVYAGREVLGKLRPRLIIGNPPDLVDQGGDLLEPLVREDLFEELDPYLETAAFDRDLPWKDTFLPGILDVEATRGKHYKVPVGLWAPMFFYDKRLFERLGLSPPKTWTEFLDVCRVLKENGIEPIAADGTEPSYNVMYYTTLMTRTTTNEHILATARNEPGTSWTEDCYLEAARLVRELRDNGYIMRGYEGSKWPSAQMQWIQGKCGLLYCGSWIPKEMKDATPEGFRMGVFRFPTVEGYPDADYLSQSIGTESFVIPKGARNPGTAVEFLKFITTLEAAKEQVALDTPSSIAGAGMPESLAEFGELIAPPYELTAETVTNEMPEWYRIVAKDLWSDFFLGKFTPEEFCRLVQESHERYYRKLEALGMKGDAR